MWKETDFILLPIESDNKLNSDRKHLILTDENKLFNPFNNEYYNIYFISDEKPKLNDWYLVELFNVEGKTNGFFVERCKTINDVWVNNSSVELTRHIDNCKKIIGTTDNLQSNSEDYNFRYLHKTPQTQNNILSLSEEKLKTFGHWNNHKVNVCFGENTLHEVIGSATIETGTDNHLYKAISISIEENQINPDIEFHRCILPKNILIEIALSCDILYTDFGFDIHSHNMKNDLPFKTLKIVKTRFNDESDNIF